MDDYYWFSEIIFDHAEKKRLELVRLAGLGPKINDKLHPKAIYTSRPLNSLISRFSSTNSTIIVPFHVKKGIYIGFCGYFY